MRRAILALVVTVAVVVWLARYETHPPRAAPVRKPGPKVIAGPVFTTPFSAIQVGVVMRQGKVVDVKTLILTGDGEHTQKLNAHAEPILRRRALEAGSAKFDVVSGATYTSESYKDSLQAAIDKARSVERRASDVGPPR
jgi:uncharacterized protein with FMN-binding domain